MNLKTRMTVLLGLLLAVFLGVLQVVRHLEQDRAKELRVESLRAAAQTLSQWIGLTSQPLQRFTRDFSEWPELAAFIARRDAAWAEANLAANLPRYEIHALWLLSNQGELVYSTQQGGGPALPPPTLPVESPARAAAAGRHFFAESRDGLLEIWAEPVKAEAGGWLVVARAWNPRFVATLIRLSELKVQLAPARDQGSAEDSPALLSLPLPGPGGEPLRQLQAALPLPDFSATLASDTLPARLLLLFGLLVIIAVGLGVHQWMLQPLRRISRSLELRDPALIAPLQADRGELGQVAGLVAHSFEQQRALQLENEERRRAELALRQSEEQVRRSLELRARLARDLHDGVIQSIYAAGLGLESAMSEFERDQTAARTRLSHCRQSLNSVIREVRGFISGLEPEQMERHGFAQELAALARTMQALWSARIAHKVDQWVATRLTVGQEVHALQIVRECISNALRHGEAKKILITLTRDQRQAVLTIRDDGRGFDPAQRTGHGSGLGNLSTRARELHGSLRIDSQPGRGTSVIITFPVVDSAPPAA